MGSLLNTLRSSKPPRIMSILYLLTVVGMVAACQPKGETHTQIKVPGFIITGGWNSAAQKKIELWNPVSRRTCPLPDLHEVMVGHSQCGNLLCGQNSCLKMTSTGSFSSAPVSLLQFRDNHLCWSLPGGGGEVDDTFIITGGFAELSNGGALNSVVRYNSQGESEVLPSLTVRRYGHACASYLNGDGNPIVLVTGGYNTGAKYLDSTELMVDFEPWRPAANLPSPRRGLQAASLDNKVFFFGGEDSSRSDLDSILSYEPDTDTWQEAGTMTLPRKYHAVAVFPDVSQLCP